MNHCPYWYTTLNGNLEKLRSTCVSHHFFCTVCSRITAVLYVLLNFVNRLDWYSEWRTTRFAHSVCGRCWLVRLKYICLLTRLLLFRMGINKWGILIRKYFFFDHLVLIRITPLYIQLGDIHISGCLIEKGLLVRTVSFIVVELICVIATINHEVIICKSQCCCLEIALFISIRTCTCNCFTVIVVGVVLSLSD